MNFEQLTKNIQEKYPGLNFNVLGRAMSVLEHMFEKRFLLEKTKIKDLEGARVSVWDYEERGRQGFKANIVAGGKEYGASVDWSGKYTFPNEIMKAATNSVKDGLQGMCGGGEYSLNPFIPVADTLIRLAQEKGLKEVRVNYADSQTMHYFDCGDFRYELEKERAKMNLKEALEFVKELENDINNRLTKS
jgi:hypothetical protein